MRVESPSSPHERRLVSIVRRLIISMRNLNFIKKDEKYIPHFMRIVPYSEWGRSPEGEEGEQHSPRDVHSIPASEHDVSSAPTPRPPDALIWMKCAKEPLPRGGAY